MSRFAPGQPDLFSPAAAKPTASEPPPLEQLIELLATLRAARRLPWPNLMAAMAAEQRVFWLGRQAGEDGARLVTAIMDETERLLPAQEQEAAHGIAAR